MKWSPLCAWHPVTARIPLSNLTMPTPSAILSLISVFAGIAGALSAEPITIVAFGDSTTALRSTVKQVYAQRLPKLLLARGIQADVINSGVGGSHTGHLKDNALHSGQHALDRFEKAVRAHRPDIVIVQFGLNDSWVDQGEEEGSSRIPVDRYEANLTQMVNTLRADNALVILMTPNQIRKNYSAWRVQRVAKYCDAARRVAETHKVPVVDVWDEYGKYNTEEGKDFQDLLVDSMHPNDKGHQLVAELLATEIAKLVSESNFQAGSKFAPDLKEMKTIPLIRNGKATGMHMAASKWEQSEGFVEGAGKGNWLYASRKINSGDFRIHARLRMLKQEASAASFFLDSNHFGFEGVQRTLYLNGEIFGGKKLLGPPTEMFNREDWIEFEVLRSGTEIRFLINGRIVTIAKFSGSGFERMGFSPLRSTMQISEFSITGNTQELPPPLNRGYSIPLIVLSAQKQRQVLLDREEGQYLGHPTTLLLEDGKTILCVYPKGHGKGAIVYKRSTDAGLTWSGRLPTPESWATSKEVPTLHRVIDAQGRKRIIMFSGLYPIRMAVTEDDGMTWSGLKPIGNYGGIVAMGCLIDLKTGPGHYLAMFHDDGRFLKLRKLQGFHVFKILSIDGGLTWSEPESIANHPTAHLCEPGIFRSPDGKQLAVLLRENSRRHNSFVIFSNDEGKTWVEPRELPGSLTGDRHTGKYGPDGRLFISFRDTTHNSPTNGDWVAWVGTYEDIAQGKEGQYRVRLMDNTKGADCAYPGVEVLSDGTFITTTYGHWETGKSPYIMSVRLKLEELDRMAAEMKK